MFIMKIIISARARARCMLRVALSSLRSASAIAVLQTKALGRRWRGTSSPGHRRCRGKSSRRRRTSSTV